MPEDEIGRIPPDYIRVQFSEYVDIPESEASEQRIRNELGVCISGLMGYILDQDGYPDDQTEPETFVARGQRTANDPLDQVTRVGVKMWGIIPIEKPKEPTCTCGVLHE